MELVFILALSAAVLWGIEPITSKRGMASGGSSLQASLIVVIVDSVLFWIAVGILTNGGIFSGFTTESVVLFFISGIVGTALGRLALFAGVDRVGASVNNAVVSTRPFFAVFLAVLILGESFTILTLIGIFVLFIGLVLIAISQGGDISGWKPRELFFPLAAAAAFGSGNVLRKFGLDLFADISIIQAVALNELGGLIALFAYTVAAGRRDVFTVKKRTLGYFTLSGTLTAFALITLFSALRIGRVVVVDPLVSTSPLFTAIFAAIFLKDLERVTPKLLAGTTLTIYGVFLIVSDPGILF